MRTRSLVPLVLFAIPAFAVDIVEMKNGKLYQVEAAEVRGNRFFMKLLTSTDKKVAFSVPMDKVVPEFVYYAWADQIQTGDVDQHLACARWARRNGLFGPAWEQYGFAAKTDPAVQSELPKIEQEMFGEQATWIYEDAEKRFRKDDIKGARKRLDLLLTKFAASKEVGRAKALVSILAERAQFLTEQRRQEKIAARARKQQRSVDGILRMVERADLLVTTTRIGVDAYNSRRRLHWAAYAYRKAYFSFDDLMLYVEVDDLRRRLQALRGAMESRIVRTFIKLADLHWIMGDVGSALDAVHEVMMVDPANDAARGLRERILEERVVPGRERIPEYPYGRRILTRAHMGRGRYRYGLVYGDLGGYGGRFYGRHRWFSLRVH